MNLFFRMTIAVAICFCSSQVLAQTTLEPVTVTAPPSAGWSGGWGGSSGGDGSGGRGGGDYDSDPCASGGGGCETGGADVCLWLLQNMPASCDGPRDVSGSHWGTDLQPTIYPLMSGLSRLINDTYVTHDAAAKLGNALARHTADLASQVVPSQDVHKNFLLDVQDACRLHESQTGGSAGGCWATLARLAGEYDGSTDEVRAFLNNFDLWPVVVNAFAPDNSLRLKQEAIRSQVQCNIFHAQVQENGC